MYTFPHLNYVNVMSGLPSPTFGKVDYFDVAPGNLAVRDAAMLREQPPTLIVWMKLSPDTWAYHEKIFRNGQPSGQREIASAIDALVASGTYRSLGTFRAGVSDPIDIYVRQAPSVVYPMALAKAGPIPNGTIATIGVVPARQSPAT